MLKILTLAGVLVALMGCKPDGVAISDGGLTAAERAECVAQGGTVGRGGLRLGDICTKPTPDAGKACKKASDCSAICMADTMTCSTVSPQFGCFGLIEEDGHRVDLCVD